MLFTPTHSRGIGSPIWSLYSWCDLVAVFLVRFAFLVIAATQATCMRDMVAVFLVRFALLVIASTQATCMRDMVTVFLVRFAFLVIATTLAILAEPHFWRFLHQGHREDSLPADLQSFTFGAVFNLRREKVSWPAGLQSFTFGIDQLYKKFLPAF